MNKRNLTVVAGTALCALSACLGLAACGGNNHTVKEIKAKDATCTEAGNVLYYACQDEGCGKLFSDVDCKHEVTLEEVTKPALGHDPQKVEAEGATCTTDGHIEYYDCSRCEVNFADAAGTQVLPDEDIFIAKYAHDKIKEVTALAPTLAADGNVYHWHCDRCEKDFNNRTGDKEIENVVIPKLVKETGLTINVTTYDNATEEGAAPTGTFALKGTEYPDSDTSGVSITEGKLSVTELIADSYKFEIEGYYPVYFTVEKGVKEYNLDLYKHFHTHTVDNDNDRISYDYLDGDLKIHYNNVNRDGDTATVHFANEKMTDSNYMAEFTVKYENFAKWTWTERFAIILGSSSDNQKHLGVAFFVAGSDIRVNEYCSIDPMMGEGNEYGRNPKTISGAQASAFEAALKSDGLQMRAMRSGKQLTVRALLDGEWVKVWEKSVDGLSKDFAIHASSPDCTFTVSGMKYFDYEGISQTHFGYFYEGTGDDKKIYSSFDAGETTLDAMKIKKQTVTVNVEVYDGLRNKLSEAPEGLKLTLTDSYDRDTIENATVANGVLSATQFLPGQYNIIANGYYAVPSLNIEVGTTTYKITLYQIHDLYEIEGNDTRVTVAEVQDDAQVSFKLPQGQESPVVTIHHDQITGNNYMMEFMLKYTFEAEKSFNWLQRMGVWLGTTSGNNKKCGVSLMITGTDVVRVSNLVSSDRYLGENGNDEHESYNVTVKGIGTTAAGDGLKIRVIRTGDNYVARVYVGGQWISIWEKEIVGLGTGMAFASVNTDAVATFSHVSITNDYTAQTDERYAYFTMGDEFIRADGKAAATLDELNIVKLENLTINVTTYLGNNQTNAPTEAFTLYGERPDSDWTVKNVTLTNGKLSVTSLYPGKYMIILDGWDPVDFTVDDELAPEYSFNWFKSDRAGNVSVDETTGDITYNNPWNGGVLTTLKEDIAGENYMTEFTLKYQFTEGKNWEWTERFSIILGMSPVNEKPIGFMFFMAGNNEIVGANCVSNDIRWFGQGHEETRPFAKDSADVTAINTALKGDGLRVRGVRNGDKLTVYFLIGTEWKVAWTKTVEGLSPYLGVTAAHNNSTLTVTGITFGEYVEATATVVAHLVVGEGTDAKVYTLDGVETTLEDLTITE